MAIRSGEAEHGITSLLYQRQNYNFVARHCHKALKMARAMVELVSKWL